MTTSFLNDFMKLRTQCLASGVLWSILATPFSFAQADRAEIFGVVLDPSGLPVPSAKVEADNSSTGVHYAGTADQRGKYHLVGLPAGQYALKVEKPGFRTVSPSGIMLRLADRIAIDVKLEIGQPSQIRGCDCRGTSAANGQRGGEPQRR